MFWKFEESLDVIVSWIAFKQTLQLINDEA